jgi:peptide/nickel transport system substrate-binding protein
MNDLPSGTVTLLFTDIEGSTRLLKHLRDGYGDVLSEHRRLLRAAFDTHGGREIDTQGDAFFVAFARAKHAVAAAVDAQRALAAHSWPDDAAVRVRMGIHTGEPVLGEDGYHGLGLHRGARICSAGHGGQVLLSNATRELLDDVELLDLGERRLKDIDRAERLWQVVYPGMPASFPPLKTADETPFEGREEELAGKVVARFRGRRRPIALIVAAVIALGVLAGFLITRGDDGDTVAHLTADSLGILSNGGRELVGTVPVGTSPSGVAVGEDAVWVTNSDSNSVSRIDPQSHDVKQTIAVGNSPSGVAVAGGFVWVANALDGTVSQIDPRAGGGKVLQAIPVGNQPTSMAAGDDMVWVANSADSTLTRIDATQGKAQPPVKLSGGADALAVGEGGVWVAGERSGTVTEIDPQTGRPLRPIGVGGGPTAVAAGAGAVWVANTLDGTVSKIDPERSSVVTTIPVGREPAGLAVGRNTVWVSDDSGRITDIDATKATVRKIVRVGNRPSAMAVDRDRLYVALRAAAPTHRGGVLRVAVSDSDVDSLDPALAYFFLTWSVLSDTNDGLVAFRRTGGSGGNQLVPDLATSIPRPAEGGKVWSFHLRRGIRYSDGRPVLAGDIRHAIERSFSIKDSPGPQYFKAIVGADACLKHPKAPCDLSDGVRASDSAGTITFRLTHADPDILYWLALPPAAAVPQDTPRHEMKSGVPATGPYKVGRVTKERVEFVPNRRFKEWSRAAKPDGYPGTIELLKIEKPAEQVAAVERGIADVAILVFRAGAKEAKRLETLRASQVHIAPTKSLEFVFLDTTRRPFDDPRVRKAVNLAVDRSYARVRGVLTCQVLPPGFVGYERYCPFPRRGDLGEARRLVRASGTRGAPVTVWTPGVLPPSRSVNTVIRAMRALGYRLRVRDLRGVPNYFKTLTQPGADPQAGWMGWVADYPAPGGYLSALIGCRSPTNYSRFCNRRIGADMRRAGRLATSDAQASRELWASIDRRLTDLGVIVPLTTFLDFTFVSQRLRNYQAHPQWSFLLDQMWVR